MTSSSALLPRPLEENLRAVLQRIAASARAAGRSPSAVELLPVTKAVSPELAAELVELGRHELAESRADALEAKAAALAGGPPVRWHFVGHLQRNKARRVARVADVIHSVDSPALVRALARITAEEGRRLEIYLQVDYTDEETKHGMDEPTLREALADAVACERLDVLGLMAMGPLVERPGHGTAEVFARAADLARRLEAEDAVRFLGGRCRLSMGMSGDLEAAVAAGSTCVRVGSDLFRGAGADRREEE